MSVRPLSISLLIFAFACTASVTRTSTGLFAPRAAAESEDEEEPPRGLSLTIESVASDGTVTLDLRNYSLSPFVFVGTPDRPRLMIDTNYGGTHSRTKLLPSIRKRRHEVAPGERVRLTTNIAGVSGRVRIGVQSDEFDYIVWTNWIVR